MDEKRALIFIVLVSLLAFCVGYVQAQMTSTDAQGIHCVKTTIAGSSITC